MALRNRQEAKKSYTRISSLGIPDKSEKKETLTSHVSRKARLGKQLHAWKGGMSRDELIWSQLQVQNVSLQSIFRFSDPAIKEWRHLQDLSPPSARNFQPPSQNTRLYVWNVAPALTFDRWVQSMTLPPTWGDEERCSSSLGQSWFAEHCIHIHTTVRGFVDFNILKVIWGHTQLC